MLFRSRAARAVLAPFERAGGDAEGPYAIQQELQNGMQRLVGIVRNEDEMRRALDLIDGLKRRAARVAAGGNREYNPGWHTALDLDNLLTVAEAVARAAIERRESRGGHFREDYPEKVKEMGTFNITLSRGTDGEMRLERVPLVPMRDDLQGIVEEMK